MDFVHGETVEIHRGRTIDQFGDPTEPDTVIEVRDCAVAPAVGADIQDRDGVSAEWVVYAPAGTVIETSDLIELPERTGSLRWRVVGQPIDWRHPDTGWNAGVEIRLASATG